ncbi:GAF domain-containing protein [Micromonospora phaseoli]|uniref:GAF domain-containing protein n=1 Tax=Micromonospora phaseoli TaxID=1144548 RepID=A0A1H7AAV9_9ACTN|nr:GAF and ANTAR domain-containing protein [Micromonospora phaseoli]PZV96483.1 GAF domain-containing protein [Micromonospora phaseoli]GIJ76172.1 GAF domain-containing protein [Micromonospora phaseoli]SEJ62759.1 GAF domain-containing protein [Micromonospora phaseoli]
MDEDNPGFGDPMTSDRRLRLWAVLADAARGGAVAVDHVCATAVAVTGVDSAAVSVILDATPRELMYATDRTASELEDLTLTLGEGPCVDATTGGPVLVADLTEPECRNRWPVFAPAAVLAGAGAIFALPLRVGGIRLGVLDLYRARVGDLGGEQLADALVLADTACAVLLDEATRPGGDRDDHSPERTGLRHPEVHQATGMVMVQMGVSAAVALIRLRAYAYSQDRRLHDVAADVVARRLRLEPAGTSGDRNG